MNSENVFEKIDLKINIQSILESVLPLLNKHPPVQRSKAMSGWALQSTNGSYEDGWSSEFCPYNGPGNNHPLWLPKNDYEKTLPPIQNYWLETEISSPQILEILRHLENLGLNPRKARIIRLSAQSSSTWHIDGSKKYYQVRLHIPLITNDKCLFETELGKAHMPADGSAYLVKVNQNHRVTNESSHDRLHFVVNIWDTKHISLNHRFDASLNHGESIHPTA